LAQRLPGEAPKTARHLGDLFRLQPPNIDRFLVLFDTAVKGGDLDTDAVSSINKAMGDHQHKSREFAPDARAGAGLQSGLGAAKPPAGRPGGGPMAPAPAVAGAQPARPESSTRLMDEEAKESYKRDGASKKELEKNGKDKAAARGGRADSSATEFGFAAPADAFFEEDRKAGGVRQLYRRLDPTMEVAENNYHHLPIQQQVAGLVTVNPFWLDYARYDGKAPFLSRNIAEASRTFTEMMFALSVLDLPFEAPKHDVAFKDGKMTLTPAGAVIAFHEEVRPVEGVGNQPPVLISQNFYRHGDRFREVDGEKLDKFVSGEF